MLIRMIVGMSGTRNGVDWPPAGGVVDIPDIEAAGMIAAGMAAPMGDVESAAAPMGDVESAAAPMGDVESAAAPMRVRRR